ncbi:hypothetical protein B0H17DRAFT_1205195 [Mycena rosella]|uniref:F-box domain-containing protein n=1 Tax=Mycena rosella TaxID=1033263 RepID=A0AAD7D881_MYCRO|nr:hypothetical protein B0H17DRAFT_1205195 [Mycena rosella]
MSESVATAGDVFIDIEYSLVIPLELVLDIFCLATMPEDPYDVDALVHDRGNFWMVHSLLLEFVDTHPICWAHILAMPRVSFASIRMSLSKCAGNAFILTLRLDDLAVLEDHTVASVHRSERSFVQAAIVNIMPHMPMCSELVLQATNAHVLDLMLSHLCLCRADVLANFTVTFAPDNYFSFEPPLLLGFHFASVPLFGRPFAPMTIFSVIAPPKEHPTITYFSSPTLSMLVSQPAGHPLDWGHATHMLASTNRLTKIVLVGAAFADSTEFLVSPALVALEIVHLYFEGSRTMAYFVVRLVVPCLKMVQITFSDRADLECAALCPHILNAALHVILARDSAEEFFEAFGTTSALPCPGSTVNWNACPVLEHILYMDHSYGNLSLQNSAADVLGFYVTKSARDGDWKCKTIDGELDNEQITYAATDTAFRAQNKFKNLTVTMDDNLIMGGGYVLMPGELELFGKLPIEILCMVFLQSFGCFLAAPRAYARAREAVRMVCKDWQLLVDGHSSAWTAVYVYLEMRIDTMEQHFNNAKNQKLTVYFDLYDRRYLDTHTWSQSTILPLVSVSFHRLALTADQCTRLTVKLCSRTATSAIEHHISRLYLPALRRLKVHFILVRPEEPHTMTNMAVYNSGPSTTLGNLVELKLQGSFPRWRNRQPY